MIVWWKLMKYVDNDWDIQNIQNHALASQFLTSVIHSDLKGSTIMIKLSSLLFIYSFSVLIYRNRHLGANVLSKLTLPWFLFAVCIWRIAYVNLYKLDHKTQSKNATNRIQTYDDRRLMTQCQSKSFRDVSRTRSFLNTCPWHLPKNWKILNIDNFYFSLSPITNTSSYIKLKSLSLPIIK